MSGQHEAPPVGSAAREATASPYIGKRRIASGPDDWEAYWFCRNCHETWWGFVPDDQLCQDCRAEVHD